MLKQRIITAAILIPLVLALILLPPTAFFASLVAIVFVGAAWEWSLLSGCRTPLGRGIVAAAAAAIFIALIVVRTPGLLLMLTLIGVGALVIVPTLASAILLHESSRGNWWTLLALVIVWAADTGAYFSGRRFGRRKLAPRISPGKTWAGVYGAIVAGGLMALLGGYLIGVRDGGQLVGLLLLGVVTVGVAVVGDLFESLMKRHATVKDSGNLFPGHGGLLDRLDSVFAALPVFAAGKLLLGL